MSYEDDGLTPREFAPSFPIHGKKIILVFDNKFIEQFERPAARLTDRGAINVSCVEPDHFLDSLRGGKSLADGFDLILLHVPVVGADDNLREPPTKDGSFFSEIVSNRLRETNMSIPCIVISRQSPNSVDTVLQGRFRFTLQFPLVIEELEDLIDREEVFEDRDVDLTLATAAVETDETAVTSEAMKKERHRLITRASEMQRLVDGDDVVSQVAGQMQWATLEGLTVTKSTNPDAVPYWQQGDLDLYTPAKLRERIKIRHHPDVVHCIREFWNALYPLRSTTPQEAKAAPPTSALGVLTVPGAAKATAELTPRKSRKYLPESGYKTFHRVLQRIVIPPEDFDSDTADLTAHTDWLRDSSKDGLTYPDFFESLFEMTDLWCQELNARAYADFLRDLQSKVTHAQEGDNAEKHRGVRWRPVFEPVEEFEETEPELPRELDNIVEAPKEAVAEEAQQEAEPEPQHAADDVATTAPVEQKVDASAPAEVDFSGRWEINEDSSDESAGSDDEGSDSRSESSNGAAEAAASPNDNASGPQRALLFRGGNKKYRKKNRGGASTLQAGEDAQQAPTHGSTLETGHGLPTTTSVGTTSGEATQAAITHGSSAVGDDEATADKDAGQSAANRGTRRKKRRTNKSRKLKRKGTKKSASSTPAGTMEALGPDDEETTDESTEDDGKWGPYPDESHGSDEVAAAGPSRAQHQASGIGDEPAAGTAVDGQIRSSDPSHASSASPAQRRGEEPGSLQRKQNLESGSTGASDQRHRPTSSLSVTRKKSFTELLQEKDVREQEEAVAKIRQEKALEEAASKAEERKRVVRRAKRSLTELELIEEAKLKESAAQRDSEAVVSPTADGTATATDDGPSADEMRRRNRESMFRVTVLADLAPEEQELIGQLKPGVEKLSLSEQQKVLQDLLRQLYSTPMDEMSATQKSLALKLHPELEAMDEKAQTQALRVLCQQTQLASLVCVDDLPDDVKALVLQIHPGLEGATMEEQQTALNNVKKKLYSFNALGEMGETLAALLCKLHPDLATMEAAQQRLLLQQLRKGANVLFQATSSDDEDSATSGHKPSGSFSGHFDEGEHGPWQSTAVESHGMPSRDPLKTQAGQEQSSASDSAGDAGTPDAEAVRRRAALLAEGQRGEGGSTEADSAEVNSEDPAVQGPFVFSQAKQHTQLYRAATLADMTPEEREAVLQKHPELVNMSPEEQEKFLHKMRRGKFVQLAETPQVTTYKSQPAATSRVRDTTLKQADIGFGLDEPAKPASADVAQMSPRALPGRMLKTNAVTGTAVVTRVQPQAALKFGFLAALVAKAKARATGARMSAKFRSVAASKPKDHGKSIVPRKSRPSDTEAGTKLLAITSNSALQPTVAPPVTDAAVASKSAISVRRPDRAAIRHANKDSEWHRAEDPAFGAWGDGSLKLAMPSKKEDKKDTKPPPRLLSGRKGRRRRIKQPDVIYSQEVARASGRDLMSLLKAEGEEGMDELGDGDGDDAAALEVPKSDDVVKSSPKRKSLSKRKPTGGDTRTQPAPQPQRHGLRQRSVSRQQPSVVGSLSGVSGNQLQSKPAAVVRYADRRNPPQHQSKLSVSDTLLDMAGSEHEQERPEFRSRVRSGVHSRPSTAVLQAQQPADRRFRDQDWAEDISPLSADRFFGWPRRADRVESPKSEQDVSRPSTVDTHHSPIEGMPNGTRVRYIKRWKWGRWIEERVVEVDEFSDAKTGLGVAGVSAAEPAQGYRVSPTGARRSRAGPHAPVIKPLRSNDEHWSKHWSGDSQYLPSRQLQLPQLDVHGEQRAGQHDIFESPQDMLSNPETAKEAAATAGHNYGRLRGITTVSPTRRVNENPFTAQPPRRDGSPASQLPWV